MDLNVYALEKSVDARLADARQIAAQAALRASLAADPAGGAVSRLWPALIRAVRVLLRPVSANDGRRRRSRTPTLGRVRGGS